MSKSTCFCNRLALFLLSSASFQSSLDVAVCDGALSRCVFHPCCLLRSCILINTNPFLLYHLLHLSCPLPPCSLFPQAPARSAYDASGVKVDVFGNKVKKVPASQADISALKKAQQVRAALCGRMFRHIVHVMYGRLVGWLSGRMFVCKTVIEHNGLV